MNVANIRNVLGKSQAEFAEMLAISIRTLQLWEQGRRTPTGAAKSLLKIVEARPDIVVKVLNSDST